MMYLFAEPDEYRLAAVDYSMGDDARKFLLAFTPNCEAEGAEILMAMKKMGNSCVGHSR